MSSFTAALALSSLPRVPIQVLTCTGVIKRHETPSYFAHAQLNSYLLPHLLVGVEPEPTKKWDALVTLDMMSSSPSRYFSFLRRVTFAIPVPISEDLAPVNPG